MPIRSRNDSKSLFLLKSDPFFLYSDPFSCSFLLFLLLLLLLLLLRLRLLLLLLLLIFHIIISDFLHLISSYLVWSCLILSSPITSMQLRSITSSSFSTQIIIWHFTVCLIGLPTLLHCTALPDDSEEKPRSSIQWVPLASSVIAEVIRRLFSLHCS